jgi:thiazole synthase
MLKLFGKSISSRLLLGTANYPSLEQLQQAIEASSTQILTVSIKRQSTGSIGTQPFWETIKQTGCHILPNTAGCRNAQAAVTTAELCREIFNTNWIKLEVIGDEFNLQPDPFELVEAAQLLIKRGFEIFPYCTDDLVLCKKLIDSGCKLLMPWAAPIGSGKGLLNPYALINLRERFPDLPLIIDAGIGKPSHVVQIMELGYDAVLLNTAVSMARDPKTMAKAFKYAVEAGRLGFNSGIMQERNMANPSTPLIDTPFWHQESLYE